MSRLLPFFTLAFMAVMMVPGFAKAEPQKFEFDKAHTQILFFADHLGFSHSSGRFMEFDGHYMYDIDDPANSSVEVTIQTDSIDMDMERWDAHMKNEDFFHVEQYPEMTFKSTAIEITGEDTADITGDLTILDVTKPVTLHVTHNKTGAHPRSGILASGFSATALIDRTEWGMDYGTPMMGPEVEIRIEVEGTLAEATEESTENN